MTELQFIEAFLRDNHEYVRERYRNRANVTVTPKAHVGDLLTEVDLTLQQRARARAAEVFPGDLFVGEEEGLAAYPEDPNARCWVMDPIDGTYNFVRGLYPMFGVSLAFARDGVPQAGGVLLPMTGDLFLAERGAGATLNGRRLHSSTVPALNAACINIDFSGPRSRATALERSDRLMREVNQVRCYGCAVVSICQVASGDSEAYIHMSLTPWDYAASQIIVEEAGGRASRLDGSPLRLFDEDLGVIFSNGPLHDEIVRLLGPGRQ